MPGFSGHGAQLYVFKDAQTWTVPPDDTSPVNLTLADWQKIGRTRDFSGPSLQVNDVDVTNNDSVNHFKEYIAGLIDPGDFTFDIVFDPNDQTHVGSSADGLMQMLLSREVRHFRQLLPIPDSGSAGIYAASTLPTNWDLTNDVFWGFDGFVKEMSPETAMEEAIMVSVGIRITGNVAIW